MSEFLASLAVTPVVFFCATAGAEKLFRGAGSDEHQRLVNAASRTSSTLVLCIVPALRVCIARMHDRVDYNDENALVGYLLGINACYALRLAHLNQRYPPLTLMLVVALVSVWVTMEWDGYVRRVATTLAVFSVVRCVDDVDAVLWFLRVKESRAEHALYWIAAFEQLVLALVLFAHVWDKGVRNMPWALSVLVGPAAYWDRLPVDEAGAAFMQRSGAARLVLPQRPALADTTATQEDMPELEVAPSRTISTPPPPEVVVLPCVISGTPEENPKPKQEEEVPKPTTPKEDPKPTTPEPETPKPKLEQEVEDLLGLMSEPKKTPELDLKELFA